MFALTARIARAIDEGEPLPDHPASPPRGEPLAGDPPRASGHFIDLDTGDVSPAQAEIERLIEWTLPVADELGLTSYLTVPAVSAASGRSRATRAGETPEEIYAREVLEPVHV